MTRPALELRGLTVQLPTTFGRLTAVSEVSLTVDRGEILGIVGESGCGKTTLALSVLRLLPADAHVTGQVYVDGNNVLAADDRELLELRRHRLAYVPQDPLASLDPTFSVGSQISETLRAASSRLTRREAKVSAVELMTRVGIRDAARRYGDAPHEFSGGMRQRVAIAIAMSGNPSLIMADEPTTALDVTVQRQILELLVGLATDAGMAMCLITHDLAVVSDVCDRLAVMYAGRVVEAGPVSKVLSDPRHPYTRALLQATPRGGGRRGRLATIPGRLPDPLVIAQGCSFSDRCPEVMASCAERPELTPDGAGAVAACWLVIDRANDDGSKDVPHAATGAEG